MNREFIQTIDDVISVLETIINETAKNENPLGYFAVLYQKVTVNVKKGIENDYFDDGKRMEKLDVIFAKRYIDAYFAWNQKQWVTHSWEKTFELEKNNKMLVLQHLLLGMNAHINLDLGIAAAEISANKNIQELKTDFNKINEILSSLVDEVQFGLSAIWPALKWILSKSGKLDNYLVDFSMEIARDGAWNFANTVAGQESDKWPDEIKLRDAAVAEKSKIITHSKKWIQFLLWIIRLGERGTVSEKMKKLSGMA
ncbi:hypothetical protein GM418_04395 [Maribellus comscasis]|uniref:Uncharacterized protein n=1 Tax=Maribellus comscasis TaxID=2681766 RepID=A0A6I6JRY6_9BACT|nr:DUF5995 family protein [Maribellus comscasis]QGY42922.1 hypothetical protein GM418_04395 [Maribellus comscasis]